MKGKLWYLLAVFVVAMLVTACSVSAGAEGNELSLEQFLTWLLSPAAIGIALSVIIEKVPFVKKYFDTIIDPDWKRFTVLGFCLAVPLLALGVGALLDYFTLTGDSVFHALAVGWDAFATSQVVHAFIRDK